MDEKTGIAFHGLPKAFLPWFGIGSAFVFFFGFQIVTGAILTRQYAPQIDKAFKSVILIANDGGFGWLFRASHAIGGSILVFMLLAHLILAIFRGSYKSQLKSGWLVGIFLLIPVFGVCFTGYLLPWSQQAFWGTRIVADWLASLPLAGESLHNMVCGGSEIGSQTLERFFFLHLKIFPLLIAGLMGIHFLLIYKSWNHLKNSELEIMNLPGFMLNVVALNCVFLAGFFALVFFGSSLFLPGEAFLPANPLEVMPQIKPAWFLLPSYQIMKIVPIDIAGFIIQGLFFLGLVLLPVLDIWPERNLFKRPVFLTCIFLGLFFFLGLMLWGHLS